MTLSDTIIFATDAHNGQLDKSGEPYILHPLRIMLKMDSDEMRQVALLHDVLEDTDKTVNNLIDKGFSDSVIDAVVAITKIKNETYEEYLKRVKSNSIALKVKVEDINDNLNRLENLDINTQTRLKNKYKRAFELLDIK